MIQSEYFKNTLLGLPVGDDGKVKSYLKTFLGSGLYAWNMWQHYFLGGEQVRRHVL